MDRGNGLKIIQKLLMETSAVERHQDRQTKPEKKEPALTPDEQMRLGLRYIRTPEKDAKFNAGDTYLDTETGRVQWVPTGVDPNQG